MQKLWIDDLRPAPDGFLWLRSVNETIRYIENMELFNRINKGRKPQYQIELIDMDHDAGDYAQDGGDYINLLNWLESTGRNYPIRIHTANTVGRDNMRTIIQKNNWKEIF